MTCKGANSLLLCLLTGCFDPGSAATSSATEDGTSGDGSTGAPSTSGSPSPSGTSDPGPSSSDTSETGPGGSDGSSESGELLSCGDGVLDEGEVCDDGNDVDGDGCNTDCIESGTVLDAWIVDDLEHAAGPSAVAIGPDGSFAIVGYVMRTDIGQSVNAWIGKFASDGTLAWTGTYNNALANGGETFSGVDIDDEGDIVVAGSEDRTDLGEGDNVLLRRYDVDGNEAWTASYTTPAPNGDDASYGVGFDDAGDIFVGGSVTRTDLGQSANFWIAGYGGGGANDWLTTYDSPVHLADICSEFDVGDDGTGYCVGYSDRGDLGQSLDAFVLATTPAGDTAWTHTHDAGNGHSEVLRSVAAGRDGGVVVGGAAYDAVHSDAWVRKLDASGDEVWTHTYSGAAGLDDLADMLAVDDDGNVIVGGWEMTPEGSATWVRKLDADGNVLWTDTFDLDPGSDSAVDAAVWPDGRILVAGNLDPIDDAELNRIWVRIYAP